MKIITLKEKLKHDWWFSDGTQPISNGNTCIVIDEDEDSKPTFFISCCSNCGDYNIEDIDDIIDLTKENE
tara:strand:+ start:4531 stop:4740 length:210 start_codon:yes stop_codon:yes gene_type:complete